MTPNQSNTSTSSKTHYYIKYSLVKQSRINQYTICHFSTYVHTNWTKWSTSKIYKSALDESISIGVEKEIHHNKYYLKFSNMHAKHKTTSYIIYMIWDNIPESISNMHALLCNTFYWAHISWIVWWRSNGLKIKRSLSITL